MDDATTRTDVLIVGGGQAGLAMGFHLQKSGLSFRILDGHSAVGASWRERWGSLRLFTPARYSALPGLAFPAAPEHAPSRDEVAEYLAQYARHVSLPVIGGDAVASLVREDDAFRATTRAGRTYEAAQVVVATGPFQTPWIPPLAAGLSGDVRQLHSAHYRNPSQVPEGEVLVVGGGNSGVQIAEELSRSRPVTLAVGARMPRLPERALGRSIFWWLERAGLLDVTVDSRLGQRMSRVDTLIGASPRMLARGGIRIAGRVASAAGDTVRTVDGKAIRPAGVVWATGYRPDHGWIDPALLEPGGRVAQRRGITRIPGLYFLGLPWMHTRGSALIGWVGRDAQHLMQAVSARARS